jgi:hypothetical protein
VQYLSCLLSLNVRSCLRSTLQYSTALKILTGVSIAALPDVAQQPYSNIYFVLQPSSRRPCRMSSIVQAFTCASLLLSVRALTCPKATLAWQPPTSAINATSLGAQDNKYGFEDGIVVRRMNGSFMMIAAEMYGDPKWVSMRLGVWTSADGAGAWTRQRTLRNSTANFDGSDPHSSSWGPFLVYDSDNSVSRLWQSCANTAVQFRLALLLPSADLGLIVCWVSRCTIQLERVAGELPRNDLCAIC